MGRRRPAQPPPQALGPTLPAPPNTPTGVGTTAPPTPFPTPVRRQPVVLSGHGRSRGARCAEVAGGTAANCAAVCCCCPCGIVSLLLLAVVKVPAGLCRRAFLKRRKKVAAAAAGKRKKGGAATVGAGSTTRVGLLGPRVGVADDDGDDDEFVIFGTGGPVVMGPGAKGLLVGTAVGWPADKSPSAEVSQMDKEMWAHFYGGGFWRSPSQRED